MKPKSTDRIIIIPGNNIIITIISDDKGLQQKLTSPEQIM